MLETNNQRPTTPDNAWMLSIKQSTPDKWILSDSGNVGRWFLVSSINRLLMIINEWILILESLSDLSIESTQKMKMIQALSGVDYWCSNLSGFRQSIWVDSGNQRWLLMLETNNQRPTLPESTQIRASIINARQRLNPLRFEHLKFKYWLSSIIYLSGVDCLIRALSGVDYWWSLFESTQKIHSLNPESTEIRASIINARQRLNHFHFLSGFNA